MTSDYEHMRQKYASLEAQRAAAIAKLTPFEIALLGIKP